MATQFVSTLTGEVAFVRFCGPKRDDDKARTCFEFGTFENLCRVVAAREMGDTFVSECGRYPDVEVDDADWQQMFNDDRVTFGAFPFTVAVGDCPTVYRPLDGEVTP